MVGGDGRTVVVVGASIGGVRTAQALRREGFPGRVVLVGEASELPYDKPPLSKQHLAGEWDARRITLLTEEAAAAAGIELRLGAAATRLDVAEHRLLLADASTVDYDEVVLATGASARPSPWAPGSGVHVIRTLDDVRALRADLSHGGPVVVVGAGFIGAETAATARRLGHAVTIVDPLPTPLGRVVGPEIGRFFTALHHRHGVQTCFGLGVVGIEGGAGGLTVRLTDGSVLPAATVVVGIGAVPNDGWLAGSGLLLDDGVVCDRYCRAIDAADVFAVGDVARWRHTGHGQDLRIEHWTNAVEQAAAVAHNIAHPDDLRDYRPVEYVWTDQYDWKVQIVGRPARGTRHEVVGDLAGDAARAAVLYTDGTGLLVGAVAVNWPKAMVVSRRLLSQGGGFDDGLAQLATLAAGPPRPGPRSDRRRRRG